jgi:hypothetical protein
MEQEPWEPVQLELVVGTGALGTRGRGTRLSNQEPWEPGGQHWDSGNWSHRDQCNWNWQLEQVKGTSAVEPGCWNRSCGNQAGWLELGRELEQEPWEWTQLELAVETGAMGTGAVGTRLVGTGVVEAVLVGTRAVGARQLELGSGNQQWNWEPWEPGN